MSKPSLYGHTKIELFNACSGKLEEVVEDDNTLTGALAEIFQGIGNFTNGSALYQYMGGNTLNVDGISYSSANYNMAHWFGGMLAFDQDQDETHPFISRESSIVAAGVYGYLNGGNNQVRGSYNSTESSIDLQNKSMKFVYDFATNQGNGTIRSVCLTPRWGGFMNEGRARTMTSINALPVDECWQPTYYTRGGSVGAGHNGFSDYAWAPMFGWAAEGHPYHSMVWSGLVPDGSDYYIANGSYMGVGMFHRLLELDPDNNVILRATVELRAGTVYLTFARYPFAGNEVDVWLGNGANSYDAYAEFSMQIELGNALYNHIATIHMSYDYEARKLYVVSHPLPVHGGDWSRWESARAYSHKNGMNTSSSFTVWEIDVDPVATASGDSYTVTTYTIPNNTNENIMCMATCWNHGMRHLPFFCYDGYIYVLGPIRTQEQYTDASSYNIYKIELENPTNVVLIDTDVKRFAPVYAVVNDAHDGRIYLNFSSGAMRVLNTRTNELYAYEELNANDYLGYGRLPIRNHYALQCSGGHLIGVKPDVLMTVNNITPVTKTAAQTMKISYSITG